MHQPAASLKCPTVSRSSFDLSVAFQRDPTAMPAADHPPEPLLGWPQQRKAIGFPESPLASLSTSLSSARRSADNLLHVAAEAERKLKAEGERIKAEWERQAKTTSTKLQASLQRLQPPLNAAISGEACSNVFKDTASTASGKKRDRSRSRMRRVRSASDFRRGSTGLSDASLHEEGKEWDLFAALNNSLSANRTPSAGSPYLAPSTFNDQVSGLFEVYKLLSNAASRQLRTHENSCTFTSECDGTLELTFTSLASRFVCTRLYFRRLSLFSRMRVFAARRTSRVCVLLLTLTNEDIFCGDHASTVLDLTFHTSLRLTVVLLVCSVSGTVLTKGSTWYVENTGLSCFQTSQAFPVHIVPDKELPTVVWQARVVMSSDAARKLLAAPKRTIRTAKQTLENCQENLQTLGNLLQQTVAANMSGLPRLPPIEAEQVVSHDLLLQVITCCNVTEASSLWLRITHEYELWFFLELSSAGR